MNVVLCNCITFSGSCFHLCWTINLNFFQSSMMKMHLWTNVSFIAIVCLHILSRSNIYKESLNVFPRAFKKYSKFNCLLLATMGLVPKSLPPLFPINGWPCIKCTLLYQSGWNTSHSVLSPLFTSTVEVGSEGEKPPGIPTFCVACEPQVHEFCLDTSPKINGY